MPRLRGWRPAAVFKGSTVQLESRMANRGREGEEDHDSPERDPLTSRGLERFLNVSPRWVARNRARVVGQFRSGRLWRFDRGALLKAKLAGQVLQPKQKPGSLGLNRRRR